MIFRISKYLFLFLFFTACKKDVGFDCFKSAGKVTNETRFPGAFHAIKVFDKIDVQIVQGQDYQVEISAGANLMKKISTEVKDSVLTIKSNSTCNFMKGYKKQTVLTVTLPRLSKLENWGVGTCRFFSFFTGSLFKIIAKSSGDIHVKGNYTNVSTYSNGNGDIYIEGSADSLDVYMYGTNFLYANNFTVKKYAIAKSQSLGNCFMNLSTGSRLEFSIYRDGNIFYQGTPAAINQLTTGSGKGRLIKED